MKYKLRHKVFYRLLYLLAGPFVKWLAHYRCTKAPPLACPALIVANHTSDLDPAFVALSFPKHLYFVASEHVTRFGFASRLIRFVFGPIIRVKGKTDAKVGMQIVRALRAGYSVCLFGEGNRSYNGLTRPIFPATGKLAKAGKGALVTYCLQGGYFASPRWAAKTRKGPVRGGVVNVYSPQQLAGMSADEVNAAIQRDIDEDAYARQAQNPRPYRGKALAEYLETALYLCPQCGALGSLVSQGNTFACRCGLSGSYDEFGALSGEGFGFTGVRDWDAWQAGQSAELARRAAGGPIFSSDNVSLYQIQAEVGSRAAGSGPLELYEDRLACAGREWPLSAIAELAVNGRQTLTFEAEDEAWEIKSAAPMSALCYQRLFEYLKAEARQRRPGATAGSGG